MGSPRKERFGYRGNYKRQPENGGLSYRERQAQARSGDRAAGGRQGTDVRHHQHVADRRRNPKSVSLRGPAAGLGLADAFLLGRPSGRAGDCFWATSSSGMRHICAKFPMAPG